MNSVVEGLSQTLQDFYKVLFVNKRFGLVAAIAQVFQQFMNQAESSVTVQVYTARKLTQAAEKKLSTALKNKLAKEVKIEAQEDAQLMAGARVEVGDWVIENSVKAQLARLAAQLNA